MPDTPTCDGCGAPLIWTVTPAGARAPINEGLDPNGNILLIRPKGLGVILAVTLSGATLKGAQSRSLPLHTNHFSDCPQRDQFTSQPPATETSQPPPQQTVGS